MKVSALSPAERTLNLKVGDKEEDVVKIVYRPGALTIEIADQMDALRNDPMADLKIAEVFLLPMLVSWDLEDEEGNELPVTREVLKTLPVEFLGQMFLEIRMDALPDPQTPATSGNGSPQEEQREGSLSGTGS